ncbi:glycosyltransferase family 2 protein [Salinimicrobium oceani]|uniref:Glycosyltransferase family 2 protein n=1 Tax=Salinimicrobium oceani TaxID=2722702 RepID=A0ABX1D0L4_9FLAO|nr:glycosyltransferase family 2 protein [Salinimicrobium oceani]NJW54036.1 glycosyltransferase family 2 protein [Salinimicrobium oceani]
MYTSLIICTYNRPEAVINLLNSISKQKEIPDEVLIIDGSENDLTEQKLNTCLLKGLRYFRVSEKERGLTRQRNFGIANINEKSEIVFFLDDDIILEPNYFTEIFHTYTRYPEALGVSGYIANEVDWKKVSQNYKPNSDEFLYDGWVRPEGSRFGLRRKFGLAPDKPPGIMPDFSHGYSTGFLPPSGKTYEVELLMGGLASYRAEIFERLQFSTYFEGYGLYEDADFSLRVSKLGKLFVNTAARLEHHHDPAGRPNMFRYGKMVVRNGWYVWRLKYPNPGFKARFKWHATSFLLTLVRIGNIVTTKEKRKALSESLGRINGWIGLLFNKPTHEQETS